MFMQTFDRLLDDIQHNRITQLNLCTPPSDNQILEVAPLECWTERTYFITVLAVLTDGSLVSGGGHRDKFLRHWDMQSRRCTKVWKGHTAWVTALAVLPDGSLVSGSTDGTLRHWDPQSGRSISVWRGHTYDVTALVILPDGSLVSGSRDSTLRHWDTRSGQCLSVWKGHTSYVTALGVLPGGSVVSVSFDKTFRHWDSRSGECLSVWEGYTSRTNALAVLSNGSLVTGGGSLLGSSDEDNALRQWDAQSGQCIRAWKGHTGWTTALAVLADGSIVSASFDKTLRHWDPQSGQCLSVWRGHTDLVVALAVLLDGSIISASYDNTLRHWPAPAKVLTLEQIEKVLEVLKNNRSVGSVRFSGGAFTSTMIQSLAQVIANHPQLSALSIEHCGLTDGSVQPLLEALKNPACKVTQCSLPHNPHISQQTQIALQQAVTSRPARLPTSAGDQGFFAGPDRLAKPGTPTQNASPDEWALKQKT